jgi:hypothetical protein
MSILSASRSVQDVLAAHFGDDEELPSDGSHPLILEAPPRVIARGAAVLELGEPSAPATGLPSAWTPLPAGGTWASGPGTATTPASTWSAL